MNSELKISKCEIILTRNCNLRCGFCFEKNDGYSSEDKIDFINLKKIVDFCCDAKTKYIFLTGGEPFTYPYLIDILQYIKKRNYPVEIAIATNGVLLSDFNLCKLIVENGVKYIDISMKGKDSKEWILETGADGSYKQAQAICNLSRLSIEFTCSMVITQENVFSVYERVKAANYYGARQFSFTFFIDNNESQEKGISYLEKYNPYELINNFFEQSKLLSSISNDWWVEYSFPMCMYTNEQLTLLKGRLASPCHIFTKDAVVFDTNMELLPCDMFSKMKMGKFGVDFLSYEDLKKFTGTQSYRSVLNKLSQYPAVDCFSCVHVKSCQGGCPVLWKNYSFEDLKIFQALYESKKLR